MNFADRVQDTITSSGTGAFTLSGTPPSGGFQAVSAIGPVGSTFPYSASFGNIWESGIGRLTAANTVVRTPLASSNAGSAVNLPAGANFSCTPTAVQAKRSFEGTSTKRVYLSSFDVVGDADVSLGSTTFGTDQGAKVQSVFDLAVGLKNLEVVCDIPIGVLPQFSDVCLKLHDNTTLMIFPGCGFIKQGAGNQALLSNYDRDDGRAGISTNGVGNKNISIIGEGSLNGNGTSFRVLQLFGVDGLVFDGPNLYNSAHFHAHLGNISNFSIKNMYIDKGTGGGIFGDGLHICGPAADGVVDNLITRNCGDDNFALNADDAWVGNTETYQPRGPIRRISATNINMQSTLYGVRVLSGGSPVDDIYIGKVTGTTSGYAVVIDCFDPAQTLVSGPGAVGTITLADIDVDVSAGGDPDLKGCFSINCKIDQLNIVRYKRKFFLNTPYASAVFGARANIANLYVEAYTGSSLNGGTSTSNQFDFRSGSNVDSAIFAFCNFKSSVSVTGYPINVQSGATIGQLTGMGNVGKGYSGFVQNNGTITNNHFANTYNFMDPASGTVDTTPPTVTGASVANSAPTTLLLNVSEALDGGFVPAASAFTVTGHTVSAVAISGSSINLTVSAFTNGEAARTVAYTQPGTNNVRDLAGNLLANFSGLVISNNVGGASTWTLDTGFTEISSTAVNFAGSIAAVEVARKTAVDAFNANVQSSVNFRFTGNAVSALNAALLLRGLNLQPYNGNSRAAYVFDINKISGVVNISLQNGNATTPIGSSVTVSGGLAMVTDYKAWFTAKGSALSARIQRVSDSLYLQPNGTWAATVVDCCTGTDTGLGAGAGLQHGVYAYAYNADASVSGISYTNYATIAAP